METEVLFLRLKTGEDLITEAQETDQTYILLNPCKVLYLKSPKSGYLSISLMQWIFTKICSEQVFEIDKREVLVKTVAEDSLVKHYWNSVEYFMNTEPKDNIEYDTVLDEDTSFERTEEEESPLSAEESMELLKKFLNIKDDKGTLH